MGLNSTKSHCLKTFEIDDMHEVTGLVFTESGEVPPAPLVRSYAMIFLLTFSLIQTIPKSQTPVVEMLCIF